MGTQLLELKWANHKSNMTLELQELYLSDTLLDVTIACGESSLKAHKTVLSASSTFFRKLFTDNPCKHPILIMTDIDFEDLKAIVQFMYKGEICISREKLTQFLKTADRLKIKGLTSIEHMDINPSQQPEIDIDLHHANSIWEHTNTQPRLQDASEAESVCNSKKAKDCTEKERSQEVATVKAETDSSHQDGDNNCMYWQSECFDQTSSSSVLPECSLPGSPTVSQQLALPPVSHQLPAHSVSHQLTSVSYKQSSSALQQQHDHPPVSHQLESSSNNEGETFTYSEIQTDRGALVQDPEPEDVTSRDIIPVNLYQTQDQSPVNIPSSTKSFETIKALNSQSSSLQDGKTDQTASFVRGCYRSHSAHRSIITHDEQGALNDGLDRQKRGLATFRCNLCRSSFGDSPALERHLAFHPALNTFSCTVCNSTFSTKASLKLHMKTHVGEKAYTCSFCHKEFTRMDNLKCHQRIHTGEKPFSCKVCNKRFAHLSNLRTHERIHSGEKPFWCKVCGKQFTHLSNLRGHERTHT